MFDMLIFTKNIVYSYNKNVRKSKQKQNSFVTNRALTKVKSICRHFTDDSLVYVNVSKFFIENCLFSLLSLYIL